MPRRGAKPKGLTLEDMAEEVAAEPAESATRPDSGNGPASRDNGDLPVAINIYVTRADRKRIKRLADDKEVSVQRLGIKAWNLLMRSEGLPELEPATANVPSGRKR